MTIHVQTFEGKQPENVHPDNWRPWINVTNREEIAGLAARRHIRNRGGVLHGETLTVHVLHYAEGDPCHANGNPKCPKITTFKVDKP